MKQFYPLIFLLFLIPAFSSAQSNYKPGYVVTFKGDTVHGYINYRDWNKNPKEITFKTDVNASDKKQYSVKNITAFGVNGNETYRRSPMWVTQDKIDGDLSAGPDSTKKLDTVFLRVVTEGKNLTLYAYADHIKKRLYFTEKGDKWIIELMYHTYQDPEQPSNIIKKSTYKIQLQKLVAAYKPGDQKLINMIQDSPYDETYLAEIVLGLNGVITDSNPSYSKYHTLLFAGLSVNNFSTSITGSTDLGKAKSSSFVSPGIDIGADFLFNKNVGTLILRTQLSVTGGKSDFTYSYLSGAVEHYSGELKYSQIVATLTPQLVYNVCNTDAFKFYIAAGIGISNHSYSSKEYNVTESYTTGGASTTSAYQLPDFKTLVFNTPLSAGIKINNKLDVFATYTPKTSLNNDDNVELDETVFTAGIHYLFSIK